MCHFVSSPGSARRKVRLGFTLLELSIVLAVIGLILGGLLVGQDMITASQRSATISDFEKYKTAINTFRDKYEAMPGDLNDATDIWGSAGGTGSDATCYMAQTETAAATCNGDGNGFILDGPALNAERFIAWKHLKNAEMVEGNFSGHTDGASGSAVFNAENNCPPSRFSGRYDIFYTAFNVANHFAESRVNEHWINASGLFAEDLAAIDRKIDDGSPVYGIIFTNLSTAASNPGCASSNAATATYVLNYTTNTCNAHYAFE